MQIGVTAAHSCGVPIEEHTCRDDHGRMENIPRRKRQKVRFFDNSVTSYPVVRASRTVASSHPCSITVGLKMLVYFF